MNNIRPLYLAANFGQMLFAPTARLTIGKWIAKFLLSIFVSCAANASNLTMNDTEMQELIRDFRQEIAQSPTILWAPLANDYYQHLGRRLSSFAPDHQIRYAFFMNRSNDINAFAGPGGTIVINTALILATEQEDELAAVMAHEIAHSEQKHWLADINRDQSMRIPMIASSLAAMALGFINPALGGGALMGSLSGFAQSNINNTRAHEYEADRIGIQILSNADYNPEGMVNFFKRMQQMNQYSINSVPAILLTHPTDEQRIADAENRLTPALIKRPQTRDPEYFFFREIVRVLSTEKSATLLAYYEKKHLQNFSLPYLQYGYALTLMKTLQFQKAQNILKKLVAHDTRNYYYQLALGGCALGFKNPEKALSIFKILYEQYPDNMAIIQNYTQTLIHQSNSNACAKAENILKNALEEENGPKVVLFPLLANAQACQHHQSEAYVTRAKLFLLEGQTREAGIALENAKRSPHSYWLGEQIDALIKDLPKRKN